MMKSKRALGRKSLQVMVLVGVLLLMTHMDARGQKSYTVKGSVADSLRQIPIPGVTVMLFSAGQLQTPVTAVLTDAKGAFWLQVKDTGHYRVEISHAGYTKKRADIWIQKEETVLPIQELVAQTAVLKDVTVTATKKLVEQMDDKIVYNAEQDPLAKSQNAIDILRRVPFISVDGDENVRLNGQSNFKVLLNGRETAMFAQGVKEALQGFPGASIVKIEVITSPSAKWDAEGVGGIINIITKKKIEGYNGSVSTWNTTINQHVSSANFNAKVGVLGVAVNYGIQSNVNIPSTLTIETIPTIPAFYSSRTLIGDRRSTTFWNYGNGEISWALDSLNTLSFYGNVSGGSNKQVLDQQSLTSFSNASNPLRSQFNQWYRRQYPTNTIGTDFIKKYASHADKEFSFRINAELGANNSFLESEESGASYSRYVINNAEATNRQYTVQSDFVQPFSGSTKLEVGARATLRRAASDFESLVRYDGGAFKLNPSNTDQFRFQQDVYAAYGSYSWKIKKYSIRTGLRLEHTRIDGNFQSAKTFAKRAYWHLLPNVQVSNRFRDLSLVLSYNQRLQRPFITHLNPFVSNNDSLNIAAGNPDLDAQTIHTITLQSTMQRGKTFMGLTFRGSYSNNMIVNLLTFNPATGVRSSTYENIGRDFLFSINGNINAPLGEKWMLNAGVNFQYRTLQNRKLRSQRNSGIAGNTSLGANYTINPRLSLNNYIGFEQALIDLQSKPNTIPYCGSGINYQVIPSKLRIGLMAQNYFAKHYDYITYMTGPTFEATNTTHSLMGKLVFSANWNFGKLKEKVSKKKGVTNDDTLTVQ